MMTIQELERQLLGFVIDRTLLGLNGEGGAIEHKLSQRNGNIFTRHR